MLEARASAWAEHWKCRAKGQAGFRKDFRTTDQVFLIQTLTQQAKNSKRKLYTCFVDFKKAFDLVPRPTLWKVLEDRGMGGKILTSLRSMYAADKACVLTCLIFDQSGDMGPAFERLLQNGNGAKATLIAKFKRLHCNQSFPMMRRLFDAVVKPTVSYGCEVWGTLCSGSLQPGLKGMAGLQIAFFRQILKLRKSISPHVIFAELAEAPWQRTWWSQVLRFMHRLDSMDEGSLHPDILSDNIHDALGNPGCCNWAAGVQKQFASLGVPSPFSGGRIRNVDHLAFRKAMLARDMSVWGGLHISPRCAPSKGAKLCTYLRWFARPDRISTEPYYELPLPVTKLRSIFHFRVGAHSLPVEQGRIQMPKVPRHLRRCTFCATNAIGDERHCLFDCPHFLGLRQQHALIFRDSHDAMRSVMWHKDQKSVCALVLAIVNEAQTL